METMEKALAKWPKLLTWLPVIVVIATAIGIRLWSNGSGNYLLVGGDGPYYPLQVRGLLEHVKLAFPDMPLFFIIEALVAKVLYLFNFSSMDNCIIMAVKLSDAFLPPLAALPVFMLAKELKPERKTAWYMNYLLIGFSVINLTTTTIFSSGLQKNAFAVIWIFSFLYYFIMLIRTGQRKYLYRSFTMLLLCALTHFGSLSVLLFFIVVIGAVWLCYNSKQFVFKWIVAGLLVLALTMIILAFFDQVRFFRLLKIPFKIIDYPVLMMMLNGENIGLFLNPLHMILGNFLSIVALIILLLNRKKMAKEDKIISFGLVFITLCLSSPLIGIEWANRLYVLSYIPVTILYLYIFNKTDKLSLKLLPAFVFSLLIVISLINIRPINQAISKQAYEEFKRIKHTVDFGGKSIVIGRQDLRLLASWEFRIKNASDYLFTKNDFEKYNNVFVIRQLKGSNFSSGRFRGDASVPKNSIKVYSGTCFELYKLKDNSSWEGGKGKPLGARGKIISLDKHALTVQNEKTGSIRIVEFNEGALINLKNGKHELANGICIEVYGERKAFSLHFIAESINEIDCDRN